jgi:hypothetical protein
MHLAVLPTIYQDYLLSIVGYYVVKDALYNDVAVNVKNTNCCNLS